MMKRHGEKIEGPNSNSSPMNSLFCALVFLGTLASPKGGVLDKGRAAIAYQEMKATIDDLTYELNRYKVELEILQEKIASLEGAHSGGTSSTFPPEKMASLEKRLARLEEKEEAIITDLKTISRSIKETEKMVSEVSSLKSSLRSTIALLEGKSESGEEYIVKKGDSLDRIAAHYKTTIQALKEKNQIKGVTIFPGQKLIIP